jgi:hypothetical protein
MPAAQRSDLQRAELRCRVVLTGGWALYRQPTGGELIRRRERCRVDPIAMTAGTGHPAGRFASRDRFR